MRTSNDNGRLSDFEQLAREAAIAVCREFNAKEFARLGEPRTWFDLQGAAAYLAISEQTLSRYVKEQQHPWACRHSCEKLPCLDHGLVTARSSFYECHDASQD